MMRLWLRDRCVDRGRLALILGVAWVWAGSLAFAAGGLPSLPGAVAKPPAWLVADAPFDVAAFFNATKDTENAAPLYLDALFEFDPSLQKCFPEGPARDRRVKAAEGRRTAFLAAFQAFQADPKSVAADTIDAAIRPYDEGFRKLALAQRRPRCVFVTGIDFSALLPHAQAARDVARVASLRVQQAVAKGDFPSAVGDVKMTLRLSRDLRPRGYLIVQLVAGSIDQVVMGEMVPAILAGPGLKAKDCKALMADLKEHESRSTDGFVEGLRGEYVEARTTLRALIHDQAGLAARLGVVSGKPGDSLVLEFAQPTLKGGLAPDSKVKPAAPSAVPPKPVEAPEPWPADLDARVAKSSPGEERRAVLALSAYYRDMLATAGVPAVGRVAKIGAIDKGEWSKGAGLLGRVFKGMTPAVGAAAVADGRVVADRRATACVVALRFWELAHGPAPGDLVEALKASGVSRVPIDPFDGKPLRLAVVEGRPVVYSVGKDGTDEGGRIDSEMDRKAGDLVFRLPEPVRP